MPAAYALNRKPAPSQMESFKVAAAAAAIVIEKQAAGYNSIRNPRSAVTVYVPQRKTNVGTYVSLAGLVKEIAGQVEKYGSVDKIPADAVSNTRATCWWPGSLPSLRHRAVGQPLPALQIF